MNDKIYSILNKILPTEIAFAHCDVPCGIYDPKPAQIAAATVLKMIDKIDSLRTDESNWSLTDRANFVRYVWTKEEHAGKCKEELLMLWTDYFKQEHLVQFPKLHEIFWNAAKLCSENKQHISRESALALINVVNEIDEIFQKTKTT